MGFEAVAVHEWRGKFYALLGLVYYREPTRDFLEGFAAAEPASAPVSPPDGALAEVLGRLRESLGLFRHDGVAQGDLDRFQGDHFRLFTGAGMPLAPPWESFYRTEERLLFSEYTLQVRAEYERFGLASSRAETEPEDHIGLELEFMAHLCDLWEECHRKGNDPEKQRVLLAQRGFLHGHLLPWANRFCRDVRRSAETPFYATVARLTEDFLEWDRRFLAERRGPDAADP